MSIRKGKRETTPPPSIDSIGVGGFKSIETFHHIEIRPLTILAGANSSGKSSMMQSILLLKQTLEASYDPGPLLLNGPNVRFTSSEQMFFRGVGANACRCVRMRIGMVGDEFCELEFGNESDRRLEVLRCTYGTSATERVELTPQTQGDRILELAPFLKNPPFRKKLEIPKSAAMSAVVVRERCFLRPMIQVRTDARLLHSFAYGPIDYYARVIQDVIHVPGLRGNPERVYQLTAVGPKFPGTFETYTASVVANWGTSATEVLKQLGDDMSELGLTWKVAAKTLDDTRVELSVGRMHKPQRGGARDLVNIADVGFGVSQTLPVVVALLAAKPGQLVFIEQPEIHLHPRAQFAMGALLARAAKRGVKVVVETHSALLLLGVQSQVAEGHLDGRMTKLHWFQRDEEDGATKINSAGLDDAGRFGDWPEDFDGVTLRAQAHYMDVAESVLARASP